MSENMYGYCPICGAQGMQRERRMGGDDKCANGHTYPSVQSLRMKPSCTRNCQCQTEPVVEVEHAAE